MSTERLRVVVGGFLGLIQGGGVAWDYAQYPAGLAALGHDVWYLEDTGVWPLFESGTDAADCRPAVGRIASVLADFGLSGKWAYRDEVTGIWHGLDDRLRRDVLRSADVFVNVSCSTVMRDELDGIPTRLLIDTDPMFTQVQYTNRRSFTPGESSAGELIASHTHHATFGLHVGAADCRVPLCGVDWITTRQPVCLERWPVTPSSTTNRFTSVMNWSVGEALEYDGERWGQKDIELRRMIELPLQVPAAEFAIALGGLGGAPLDALQRAGWTTVDASAAVPDWSSYRRFIQESSAEFSVAKETYVKARTGWFSCRSACYLASGRPVIAQDTGWSSYLPTGRGLLAFDGLSDGAEAVREVMANYRVHSEAARDLAADWFGARDVLTELLDAVTR